MPATSPVPEHPRNGAGAGALTHRPPPPAVPAMVAAAARAGRSEPAPVRRPVIVPPRPPLPVSADAPPEEAPAAPDVLVLQGVTKSFGAHVVVDGVDLTVRAGTLLGLVGANGAGKTTTLSLVAGLLRPDHGTIRVHGVDVAAHPRRALQAMGVLPDRLRTFDRLTAEELLLYTGLLRGMSRDRVRERVRDLTEVFDLAEMLPRRVSDCSTGMARRLLLAAAMIHSPRLLVLDEPFRGVDPVAAVVIGRVLDGYAAHGGAVVLSGHDVGGVQDVCTHIALMADGMLVADGPVGEMRARLAHEPGLAELLEDTGGTEVPEWLHTFSE